MIYKILRPLAALALTIYFRKIYVIDAHHLPKHGPVILACNHPSAFMEACLLACFLPRPLHFLTRGDFFKRGLATWFLRQTNQIPIYRARDGFGNLRSNKETFEACYDRLARGDVILMFPEARTILEKRLRPVQKGAARIGLGVTGRHPDVVPVIVPVGVTYSDPRQPGGDVILKFSKPIALKDYTDQFREQPQEAVRVVTERLEAAMRSLIIHFDDVSREQIFDLIMPVLETAPQPFPVVSRSTSAFDEQQAIATMLNEMDNETFERMRGLPRVAAEYGEIVRPALQRAFDRPPSISVGLPVYLAGKAVNAPVNLLLDVIVARITAETFKGPVRAMAGFIICAAYYLIIVLIGGWYFGSWGAMGGLVVVMIGYFAVANARMSDQVHWLRWSFSRRTTRQQITQALAPATEAIGTRDRSG
ncbi:MAG: 1-acyl-sn-glycerol-3-phosphate acyltransferase [Saprospiraceae bacterium]|nr:1-acyl-sn-glycerol-3-phosphate acyltransferase [Saprospiraceae bacterium]